MKKLLTLLTLMVGVGLALGQGIIHNPGIVSFLNTEAAQSGLPSGVTNHLVYDTNGSALVGTTYRAELFQVNPDNSLTPIPESISPFKISQLPPRPSTCKSSKKQLQPFVYQQ